MSRMILAGVIAVAFATTACAGAGGVPTSPSAGGSGSTAFTAPGIAKALTQAVANCEGDVFDVLRSIFGGSALVDISDDGSTLTFGVSSAGHTSSHNVAYIDNDSSGNLSCGDTVTSVS